MPSSACWWFVSRSPRGVVSGTAFPNLLDGWFTLPSCCMDMQGGVPFLSFVMPQVGFKSGTRPCTDDGRIRALLHHTRSRDACSARRPSFVDAEGPHFHAFVCGCRINCWDVNRPPLIVAVGPLHSLPTGLLCARVRLRASVFTHGRLRI